MNNLIVFEETREDIKIQIYARITEMGFWVYHNFILRFLFAKIVA